MKIYWKILVFGVFLALAQTSLLTAQTAPLPPGLTSARTAFVVNDGVWTKTFDKFFKEMHKWGRFEFVATRNEADIVIVLSNQTYDTGATYTSTTHSGTGSQTTSGGVYSSTTTASANTGSRTIQVPIESSTYYIDIVDSANGELLWSDSKGTSFLGSNSAKGLVSNLKKRFKGVGYTTPIEKPEIKVAPVSAQEAPSLQRDGNELLKLCTQAVRSLNGEALNGTQDLEAMHCFGYVAGYSDARFTYLILGARPFYCAPDGVKIGQTVRILVKWMNDNPEQLHNDRGTVTMSALLEAFPCQKEAPSP